GWESADEVGGDNQRAGSYEQLHPGPLEEPVREGMVGDGPVGIDALLDDLADRIRLHDVDSLERGDDSLLGRRQRRRRCGETNVGTPLGGGLVERGAQICQAALAADRGRLPGR